MGRRAAVLLWVLLVCAGPWAARGAEDSPPSKDDHYELYKVLVDAMDQVERNYVKEVDRRELMEAAIEGVLSKLDPYSTYINPEEISQFRSTVESEFGGIGIQISQDRGELKILSPLFGTPAYRAGLLAGDRIVEIGGETTDGLKLDDAVRRLKGKEGTSVKLTVIHPGSTKRITVEVTRERIRVDTVLGDHRDASDQWDFMLEPKQGIGYIRVTAFSRDTADDLRKALEKLRAANMRGLILDLRFNPGGLLSAAIQVSDLFVSKGRIVSTEGRNSPERVWDAREEGTFEGFPMAVLVNRYSASASEIVSACLQDQHRAVVVGERTYGKGSVQNVIDLEDGRSALKLTTAGYRRPNGKNIDHYRGTTENDEWGVTPDAGFETRLGDAEILGLMQDRRDRDILRTNHSQPEQSTAADSTEKPPADQAAGQPQETRPEETTPGPKAAEPAPAKEEGEPAEPAAKPVTEPAAEPTPAEDGGKAAEPAMEPTEKPAEKPAAESTPAASGDGKGAKPEQPVAASSPEAAFIDRQLQMALEYLTGELARSN